MSTDRVLILIPSHGQRREFPEALGFRVQLASQLKPSDLDTVNYCILYRLIEPEHLWIINECANRKIPYIYQLDENFFHMELNTERGAYFRLASRIYSLREFVRCASLVRVPTEKLKATCEQYNRNVKIYLPFVESVITASPSFYDDHAVTRLVYSSSRNRGDHLQDQFSPAVLRLLKEYPGQLQVTYWGPQANDHELSETIGFRHRPYENNYEKYRQQFVEAQFDIGLVPADNSYYSNSKPPVSYNELAGMNVAGIFSRTEVFEEKVSHEENGLLVGPTSDEWYLAIKRLVEDRRLRSILKNKAASDVRANHTVGAYIAEVRKDIFMLTQVHYKFSGVFWNRKTSLHISPEFEAVAGAADFYRRFKKFFRHVNSKKSDEFFPHEETHFIFSNNYQFVKSILKQGVQNQYIVITSDAYIKSEIIGSLKLACILIADENNYDPGQMQIDRNLNAYTFIEKNPFILMLDHLTQHFGVHSQPSFSEFIFSFRFRRSIYTLTQPWSEVVSAWFMAWRSMRYQYQKKSDHFFDAFL